ncbi:hypothetical protein PRIPAC_89031 [Pristionchus pacificus]|uniref:PPM-type phosphatase domain-containing protein n=1 Tax=Pristionchus pacificus TaxID=54126 RepID=A0A2A6BZ66_PRIPA|nr:hypothetical protein PRIPAC_89031 [Pristionchus pacificus]|eukprot:PDM71178.1 hypothetical protein PRIPAC_43561 [Pristionchus pacificus]
MPGAYLKRRVVDLLRTKSSPPQSIQDIQQEDQEEDSNNLSLLAHLYLTGLSGHSIKQPELYFGKTGCDLPLLQIDRLESSIVCACTGPEGGLTNVEAVRTAKVAKMVNLDDEMCLSTDGMTTDDEEDEDRTSLNGSSFSLEHHLPTNGRNKINTGTADKNACDSIDWSRVDEEVAFGSSVSLYERNPLTGVPAGNPIADVYAVCARENNAILALADGVNWGDGARLAARCAVRGAMDHLNHCILTHQFTNTNEVFHELLASFHRAHSLILQEEGMLTTLCVAVALPVSNSNSWVLCVCNVGDSLCFVYNSSYGVREVTLGSHDSSEMRDMRNAGGALGPVDGRNPQLQNLTCSETFVESGDLIFITSDGISDNFDPVVGKFCVIKKTEENENPALPKLTDRKLSVTASGPSHHGDSFHRTKSCAASIPCIDATQRQNLMLLRMRDIISNGFLPRKDTLNDEPVTPRPPNPSRLCTSLTQFATQLSTAKRRVLENPELYKKEKLTKSEERARRKMVRERIADLPGKLDHASVVAYRVGCTNRNNKTKYRYEPKHENSLPTETVEANVNLEHFTRQSRASCERVLEDKEGEREQVSLKIPLQSDETLPNRATSPYEEIRIDSSSRSKRRHSRGSTARHTLSVDVAWLKKLVTRKDKDEVKKLEEETPRSFSSRIRGLLSSNKNLSEPPMDVSTPSSIPSSHPVSQPILQSNQPSFPPRANPRFPRPISTRSQSTTNPNAVSRRSFHLASSVSHV